MFAYNQIDLEHRSEQSGGTSKTVNELHSKAKALAVRRIIGSHPIVKSHESAKVSAGGLRIAAWSCGRVCVEPRADGMDVQIVRAAHAHNKTAGRA